MNQLSIRYQLGSICKRNTSYLLDISLVAYVNKALATYRISARYTVCYLSAGHGPVASTRTSAAWCSYRSAHAEGAPCTHTARSETGRTAPWVSNGSEAAAVGGGEVKVFWNIRLNLSLIRFGCFPLREHCRTNLNNRGIWIMSGAREPSHKHLPALRERHRLWQHQNPMEQQPTYLLIKLVCIRVAPDIDPQQARVTPLRHPRILVEPHRR